MSDSSYDSSWGTDFESESFPRGLVRTRLSQIFRDIWDDSEHPRHRQYHEAIHPKLWACRCFPPPPIEVDEEDDEYKDGGDHCPQFLERYEIYAYIGGGSAGRVWAARRRVEDHDGGYTYNHFAVKIMQWQDENQKLPSMTVRLDVSDPARKHIRILRYLKFETLTQILVGDMAAHIPEIVEVYSHNPYVIIVMDLSGYKHEDLLDSVQEVQLFEYPDGDADSLQFAPKMFTCSGREFGGDYTPDELLKASELDSRTLGEMVEAQICMMFHGLLQAFHHLFDRGVTHLDFEGRNFLADANSQAYLIDFGLARQHAEESDYHVEEWSKLRSHRDPEFDNPDLLLEDLVRTDGRRLDLWSFASVLYDLLHKTRPKRFCTYEVKELEPDGRVHVRERNKQEKDPLDLRENLSQDCSDVLQASLNIFPHRRPNVEELCTFPWFNGWQYDADVDFTNPHMNPYEPPKTDEQVEAENAADWEQYQQERYQREHDSSRDHSDSD